MKNIIIIIICSFFLGCTNAKINFYEKDFYGNSIKIPVFLQHNTNKENLKYYCKNNFYLRDSLGVTFFEARLCNYRSTDNSEYNFEFLKKIVEDNATQMKDEIPEMDILSVVSTKREEFFLYEIIRASNDRYSKIVFITFESNFIYINYETEIKREETLEYLNTLTQQFKRKEIIKNIVLPRNTDSCNYCHKVLLYW